MGRHAEAAGALRAAYQAQRQLGALLDAALTGPALAGALARPARRDRHDEAAELVAATQSYCAAARAAGDLALAECLAGLAPTPRPTLSHRRARIAGGGTPMSHLRWPFAALLSLVVAGLPGRSFAGQPPGTVFPTVTFAMRPASAAIAACLPGAQASGTIVPDADNDTLALHAAGLPPFAAFDLYLTARPRPPYGVAWPLTLLHADAQGVANVEVQASLLQAAAVDGTPATATHLVLFFDNPDDAAGCFGGGAPPITPYNANQDAGPAALATTGYPDAAGPLHVAALPPPGRGFNSPDRGPQQTGRARPLHHLVQRPRRVEGHPLHRLPAYPARPRAVHRPPGSAAQTPVRLRSFHTALDRRPAAGQPGTLTTPLTQMVMTESTVAGSGTAGKVVWGLAFTQAAHGQSFQQSVRVTDLRNQTSGWNPTGTWTVG